MKIKITERGYAGHFCGARHCLFHRNTLIEYGKKHVIVSTVGNYRPCVIGEDKSQNEIGCNRFYETMVFEGKKLGVYWEIDASKEIAFKSNWALSELEQETDAKADKMHEKVVKEISKKIK